MDVSLDYNARRPTDTAGDKMCVWWAAEPRATYPVASPPPVH